MGSSEEEKKSFVRLQSLSKYNPEVTTTISQSILGKSALVAWDDLIGLEALKKKIMETIVLPMKNPELFTGLRSPSKGILLFGPPGNGKTMVAKATASQCEGVTFFNLSAGTLTSKHYGDSEKLIQALFAMASAKQPSVIFIDEIDSILGSRSSEEHEASRRIKTEFLVQFDGVGTEQSDRVVVMGATNRPFDLDEAVLRRFTARIFLPLPNLEARTKMLQNMLKTVNSKMSKDDIKSIAKNMEGYSYADMKAVCQEAAMEPIRKFAYDKLTKMKKEEVPPIISDHFKKALAKVKASVSKKTIAEFSEWNKHNQK